MRDFNVPENEQYTVHDILILKHGQHSREYKECINYFQCWHHKAIGDISYEEMKEHCHRLLSTSIIRGGGKAGGGREKLPSKTTILRKFAYLAASISSLISQGMSFDNHAIKIVAYLRAMKKNPYEECAND